MLFHCAFTQQSLRLAEAFVQRSGIRLLRSSLRFGILTAEALNTTRSVHQFLLASKKRMAIRTDFEVNVAFMGRAGCKAVPARANYPDFLIIRMNTLLWHDSKKPFLQSLYFTGN
jgi:hypothetical protein